MGVKLVNEKAKNILLNEMKDGQIAEIVRWESSNTYVGRIVQRYKDDLITIGKSSDRCWSEIFIYIQSINCQVRILEEGELLEITYKG